MSLKPHGRMWSVKEQIIEDPHTGITLQFEVMPSGEPHLRVYGNIFKGNREYHFDKNGKDAGSGTIASGVCKPCWVTRID